MTSISSFPGRPRSHATSPADAHRVPPLEVDDLVVELYPAAAAHHDVHLFLRLVRVAVGEAETGRRALKVRPDCASWSGFAAARNLRSGAPSNTGPMSSRSFLRFLSVNGKASFLPLLARTFGPTGSTASSVPRK